MGVSRKPIWTVRATAILFAALSSIGCQSSSVSTTKLVVSQSHLDFDGLESTRLLTEVSASGASPRSWAQRPLENNAIYTHQQWRSPTGYTGVGIVFVHLPLPVGPSAVLWLAEQHFASMPGQRGKVLGEWTDVFGRSWFAAKNAKADVCGYIMTQGSSAWIVYFAHKLNGELHPVEMSLAARSVESIVPMTDAREPVGPNVADASRDRSVATE